MLKHYSKFLAILFLFGAAGLQAQDYVSLLQENLRMGVKREKPEDLGLKLRQFEVLQGQGKALTDAVGQIGDTVQT